MRKLIVLARHPSGPPNLILFPLGLMNLAVMALVTALIFAEKALPMGRQISLLAGIGLIVYGLLVLFLPAALPMGM